MFNKKTQSVKYDLRILTLRFILLRFAIVEYEYVDLRVLKQTQPATHKNSTLRCVTYVGGGHIFLHRVMWRSQDHDT